MTLLTHHVMFWKNGGAFGATPVDLAIDVLDQKEANRDRPDELIAGPGQPQRPAHPEEGAAASICSLDRVVELRARHPLLGVGEVHPRGARIISHRASRDERPRIAELEPFRRTIP